MSDNNVSQATTFNNVKLPLPTRYESDELLENDINIDSQDGPLPVLNTIQSQGTLDDDDNDTNSLTTGSKALAKLRNASFHKSISKTLRKSIDYKSSEDLNRDDSVVTFSNGYKSPASPISSGLSGAMDELAKIVAKATAVDNNSRNNENAVGKRSAELKVLVSKRQGRVDESIPAHDSNQDVEAVVDKEVLIKQTHDNRKRKKKVH